MNYRSFSDLDTCITRNLWKIPLDVDLIVGVPRSGLLAASAIALHLNLPLADLDGFLENRVLSGGARLSRQNFSGIAAARRILIVDDSVATGAELARTKAKLQASEYKDRVLYLAVYALEESANLVDIHFEVCPGPRVFAWNLMHRHYLKEACVDIDGVLCLDPTDEENDDGVRYRKFLNEARILLKPTYEIGTLVTSRLEKYRPETEAWLKNNSIPYKELVMWDLPDKAARIASGGHADFKAAVFRAKTDSGIFIESSAHQAQRIADLSCKPVICIETQRVHTAGARQVIAQGVSRAPKWAYRVARRLFLSAKPLLLKISRTP